MASKVEHLNRMRVKRFGEEAMRDYDENDPQTNLVDLLADAMHWCHKNGVSFDEACETARCHYAEESTEPPPAISARNTGKAAL